MTNTPKTQAGERTQLKWNDPALWRGVRVQDCTKCGKRHVTRNGLCWTCEHETVITLTPDEFGTLSYSFEHEGQKHECFDFSTKEDALSGARFHLHCLAEGLEHQVIDGLGAQYTGPDRSGH